MLSDVSVSAHARQEVDTSSLATATEALVVNELLCFVQNKRRILPDDTVIQLCRNFYDDDAVEDAKKLLYNHCADESDPKDRYIARSGEQKRQKHLKDMLDLISRKGGDLQVKFVAKNIVNLPCVSFDNIDVSVILSKLEKLETEVALLRSAAEAQSKVNEDLHSITYKLSTSGHSDVPELETPYEVDSAGIAVDDMSVYAAAAGSKLADNKEYGWSAVVRKGRNNRAASNKQSPHSPSLTHVSPIKSDASTAQPNKSEASTAQPKRSRARPVVGKGRNVAIKPAKKRLRLANVFTSRLDPELTAEDLRDYLVSVLSLPSESILVEQVKRTDWHTSFHIKCECTDPSRFMDADIWPEDAYVRWWREAKPKEMSNDSSAIAGDATLPKSLEHENSLL